MRNRLDLFNFRPPLYGTEIIKRIRYVRFHVCCTILFLFLSLFNQLVFFFSFPVGERPLPSISPAPNQKFSRHQNRRGGGLVLECVYILYVADGAPRIHVIEEVRALVSAMEGNETVLVEE